MSKSFLVLYLIFLVAIISCDSSQNGNDKKRIVIEGLTQGTSYKVVYFSTMPSVSKYQIDSILSEIDESVSTYNPRSLLSTFNASDSGVLLDKVFKDNLILSLQIYRLTKGAFNPFAFPIFKRWFEYKESNNYPTLLEINNLLKLSDSSNIKILKDSIIKINPKTQISFDAIAQGYSVDEVSQFLRKNKVNNFLVEIGGELRAEGLAGKSAWIIGLEKPTFNATSRDLLGKVKLKNQCIATSGNYRKFFKKNGKTIGHTINPITGNPAYNNLLSVSVVTNSSCAKADALATAFMVMGVEKAKNYANSLKELEVILVYLEANKPKVWVSDKFKNSVNLSMDCL